MQKNSEASPSKRLSISVMSMRFASAVCATFVTSVPCCGDVLTWYSSGGYCPIQTGVCVCVCAVCLIFQTSHRIITLQKDDSFSPSVAFLIHLSSFSQSVPWWEQSFWQVWMGICVNVAVSMCECELWCKGCVISVIVSLWGGLPG